MSQNTQDNATPVLKPTLRFFNDRLTQLNDKRLQLNRGKSLARYIVQSQKCLRPLSALDTTMGISSFFLYILRFSANLGLLMALFSEKSAEVDHDKQRRELYYNLLNDSLWAVVNMTQFFWLSYRNSVFAGLRGMQLETLAQITDLLVMIIRYQQDKEEYNFKCIQLSGIERSCFMKQWRFKQLNLIRALITGLCVATVIGLFAFSLITVPIAPVISLVILISSLLRLLIEAEKDRQVVYLLKINGDASETIINKERTMGGARLNDLNQIILNSIFIPLGLFLAITASLPFTAIMCLSMIITHLLINRVISQQYSSDGSLCSDPKSEPLSKIRI